MNYQLAAFFGYLVGYILLLTFCEFLNRKMKVGTEYTRKLSHIAAVFCAMLFPYLFQNVGYVLVLSGLFFVMLVIARRKRIIPSVDNVERKTGGSYFLTLGICIPYYLSVVFENPVSFMLPMLIFAISDPLAGLVGSKWIKSKRIINNKTIAGSLAFLFSSLVICMLYFNYVHDKPVIALSLMIAVATSVTELLSGRGTDNFTVPLVACVILLFFGL